MMASTPRDVLRRFIDRIGTGVAITAVIVALIPLVAMLAYIVDRGASSITWNFFTQGPPVFGMTGGGMGPMIVGSLLIMAMTSAIGIPIGLFSGIYLADHGGGRYGQTVCFVTDVIAGTPSILAGVIIYAILNSLVHHFAAYQAALALALLMFPTVTRATEEAIRAVPSEIREAGLGLGAPEWKLLVKVLIPTSAAGIVTAIVLGVARVAGETAPLYFTAFGNDAMSTNVNGPIGALPLQIWVDAQSPSPIDHSAAYAGAFVLFCLILILNLTARGLTFRLTRRTRIA